VRLLRWTERNAYLKEQTHFIDLYDQALMDYKAKANDVNLISLLNTDNGVKSVYLALSRNILKEIEHELIELGHEIGIPIAQTRLDIDNARKGGKIRIFNTTSIRDDDNGPDVIRIRKRKMNKIKSKREIITKCRCKK
jgi:hypothetical protein